MRHSIKAIILCSGALLSVPAYAAPDEVLLDEITIRIIENEKTPFDVNDIALPPGPVSGKSSDKRQGPSGNANERASQGAGNANERASQGAENANERASQGAENADERASQGADNAAEAAENAAENAAEAAENAAKCG